MMICQDPTFLKAHVVWGKPMNDCTLNKPPQKVIWTSSWQCQCSLNMCLNSTLI